MENLFLCSQGFSDAVRAIFGRFDVYTQVERVAKAGMLHQVTERFPNVDLHPDQSRNSQMGLVFGEIIRKFAVISDEAAGEHFTPREVIRPMVNRLLVEDDEELTKRGVARTIGNPAADASGMLSVAGDSLEEHNPEAPADHVRLGAQSRVLRQL